MLHSLESADLPAALVNNCEPFAHLVGAGSRRRAGSDPQFNTSAPYVFDDEYGLIWNAPEFNGRTGHLVGECHRDLASFANHGFLDLPFRKAPRCRATTKDQVLSALEAMVNVARRVYPDRTIVLRGQAKEYLLARSEQERQILYCTKQTFEPSLHPSASRRAALSPMGSAVWAQLVQKHYAKRVSYHPVQHYPATKKLWPFATPHGRGVTLAFAQHYGLPTPAIDVTVDPRVALWFALNEMKPEGNNRVSIRPAEGGDAVVYVIASQEGQYFDWRVTEGAALRALRQAGGFLASNWGHSKNKTAKHIVGAVYFPTSLSSEFLPELPTAAHLFPGPAVDSFVSLIQGLARKKREFSRSLAEISSQVYWVSDSEWDGVHVPVEGIVPIPAGADFAPHPTVTADNLPNEQGYDIRSLAPGEAEYAVADLAAAAAAGDVEATYRLGWLLSQKGDPAALDLLRTAAEAGHISAMNDVGLLYAARREWGHAERWYRLAAERGSILSAWNLGAHLLRSGRIEEAERFLVQAAEGGDPDAACAVGGLLYERGCLGEAATWLEAAAAAGHAAGAYNLGLLHKAAGRLGQARRWFRRAKELGDLDAEFQLLKLK